MLFPALWQLLLSGRIAAATTLFVASYSGTVTTLSLTEDAGNYSLTTTATNSDCEPNPSWLTLDANRGLLFCLNEGLNTLNGSLGSFTISRNGTLKHVQNTTTISGPVSGVIYGEPAGKRGIALSHYTGSAVTSWYLDGGGKFSKNENFTFSLDGPGPNPDRQDAPHEHEAILDPTGQYLLVPDLGADLVRVFSYDEHLKLKELSPLQADPGDGPRHAAFWTPYSVACETCTTYLYVVNELKSTVTGYAVTYKANSAGLEFDTIYNGSTFGYLGTPPGSAPSEILVSPDNRYLVIGNRNDSTFNIQSPSNSSKITSDSISTFALIPDGSLRFSQLAPAYGRYPRHFSTNAIGSLLAVGIQYGSEVVILGRDITTGLLGEPVAAATIDGQISNVLFYEEHALGYLGG